MLGKVFHFSEIQFSHLYNGEKIFLMGILCHTNKKAITGIHGM